MTGRLLDTSADGHVGRGLWQDTAGVSRNAKADEISSSDRPATIELEAGSVLELARPVPVTIRVLWGSGPTG